MKIIAITNQKGGTAKTTTAAALGVLLARSGTPTHLVDMDPQASLTRAFGLTDESDGLYHALTDRAGLPVKTVSRNLTLTPSSIELGRSETELLGETGREFFLRTSLQKTLLPGNTIVLLDCPPSLGVLAVNCLATAGGMIAVIQPGGFELHALAHLHITAQAIRERQPGSSRPRSGDHQRPPPPENHATGLSGGQPRVSVAGDRPRGFAALVRHDSGYYRPAQDIQSPGRLCESCRATVAGAPMSAPQVRGITGLLDGILSSAHQINSERPKDGPSNKTACTAQPQLPWLQLQSHPYVVDARREH